MSSCNPFPILVITDGTTIVDLSGINICVEDWIPGIPTAKGGGVWQSSPLSDGRQLADWKWENWIDTFTIHIFSPTQDATIRVMQELHRLLVKAVQYWTSSWQSEPVWIEAKASFETNTRYAIVKSWLTPQATNPFGQVFYNAAMIDSFQLTVEHTAWQSTEPGTGTCVQVSGTQDWCFPYYLEYNGDSTPPTSGTSMVVIPSDALIDNWPSSSLCFTAEAWIRANGWGESNVGSIFSKRSGTTGWYLRLNNMQGIEFWADFNTTDMLARSGLDDFTPDSEWHHVAVTCDNPTANAATPRMWIDGVEVSYQVQNIGVTAYGGDIGDDLVIGNDAGQTSTFEGDIGWCRLSIGKLYTADFTPPDRCVLPDITAATIGQWIGVESTGATIDNQEGSAAIDGAQTDCEFECDCDTTFGRAATCLEEVYIANKHNVAQLTHIYVDNGGVFGENLLNAALPYDLLPAVPIANDAVYFGIATGIADGGPFCSLAFDIGTAITGVTSLEWEYYRGAPTNAWVALDVQDNTNADGAMTGVAFDTEGVGSVHWAQPSTLTGDWEPIAINGVTAYWVRARVAVAAGATAPTQQHRQPYTILWPYVEIDETQVGGDITALARVQVINQSDHNMTTDEPIAWVQRLIAGVRSLSRGENFTAYINLANEQNPGGIEVTASGVGAFATNVESPTGVAITVTNPAAAAIVATVTISDPLVAEYDGVYRLFLRGEQTTDLGDSVSHYITAESHGVVFYRSEEIAWDYPANVYNIIDFGQITLKTRRGSIEFDEIEFDIYASGDGVEDAVLFDLILMPVDEFAVESLDVDDSASVFLGGRSVLDCDVSGLCRTYLDINPLTYPKQIVNALRRYSTDYVALEWKYISPTKPQLQANSDQRVWFLCTRYPATPPEQTAEAWIANTILVSKTQRYLYARGNR